MTWIDCKPIVLWRSRCRCRRRCLSSLINMKKTNFMIITSTPKPTIHNINILNIDRKTSIKYLDIYLDEHLKWKTQIAHVRGKLTKNLGILYQLRNYLNLKMLRQLHFALIYPYLITVQCVGATLIRLI